MIHYSKFCGFIVCLSFVLSLSVSGNPTLEYASDPISKELESFGENKVIPDKMREVILTALSYYPELERTNIEFSFKDNIRKSVMQAQPKFSSFFRKKSERKYIVKISRYLKLQDSEIDILTLPFEVLIGWIGHELGHIVDYQDRGSLAMLGFGAKYLLSEKFVVATERRADLCALKHGLGNHIMETKNYVLNHTNITEEYKKRIQRLYMSPEDFRMLLGETAP